MNLTVLENIILPIACRRLNILMCSNRHVAFNHCLFDQCSCSRGGALHKVNALRFTGVTEIRMVNVRKSICCKGGSNCINCRLRESPQGTIILFSLEA